MRSIPILLLLFLFGQCSAPNEEVALDISTIPSQVNLFAPNVISTAFNERDMAISPDGRQLIFTRANHNNTKRVLVHMTKIKGDWSAPELMSFSGVYNDIEPFFSTDGTVLYFCSDRPMNNGQRTDYNIWKVSRSSDTWSLPKALPPVINSENDEFFPAVSENGNLYFTAAYDNAIGKEDIYVSKFMDGAYITPVPLDSNINSSRYEFNAYVSPDESLLVFSSFGRADDMGGGDLYYSVRDSSGVWQSAKHMGSQINSNKLDYCPFIDWHHAAFYFSSQRQQQAERYDTYEDFEHFLNAPQNGMGDIYWVRLDGLPWN